LNLATYKSDERPARALALNEPSLHRLDLVSFESDGHGALEQLHAKFVGTVFRRYLFFAIASKLSGVWLTCDFSFAVVQDRTSLMAAKPL
jgi:hypothetical protein